MAELMIEHLPIALLRPWAKNARTHSNKQVRQIADSIQTFGFTNPVLVDRDNTILAGHGRIEAARLIGMSEVHLMETKPFKLVAVATANKLARIAFALMRDKAQYAGT